MKALIFDSGTLINLSMNGLLYLLEELKRDFDGKFLITRQVKYEVIDRPIGIPRFELGALEINTLLDKGILELPSAVSVTDEDIAKETKLLMDIANHFVMVKGKFVEIVSEGEISCIALSKELVKKNVESLIAVDERTTRLLGEKPANLEKTMADRLHQRVEISPGRIKEFASYKFIRSSEIVFVAYKKGLLKIDGKKALEAALYATKYKGCAISFEEIDDLRKLS